MNTPVECRDLTVRYGRTLALDRVSFAVPEGQVYALLGRNGAGKSSLVRCLLGQQKASGGEIRIFGEDAWTARESAMARTGVMPEDPDVPRDMGADAASAFCASLHPRWDAKGVAERLDRFQIPRRKPSGQLSRGQRAQLSLALALGSQPELLVLDDPTLGLDALARKDLYQELLGELADRGTTVFLTTHDLAGIEGIADRVGILNGSHLLVDEDLEALKARFRTLRCAMPTEECAATFAAFNVQAIRETPFGTECIASRFDEAALAALRAGGLEVEAEALSLEAIFIALAGQEAER